MMNLKTISMSAIIQIMMSIEMQFKIGKKVCHGEKIII